jgi:succinate--hydroxymethylglutarate CoA-transferase
LAEKVLEDPSLATDPKFISNETRVRNRTELIQIITDKLMEHDREYWLKKFTGLGYVQWTPSVFVVLSF